MPSLQRLLPGKSLPLLRVMLVLLVAALPGCGRANGPLGDGLYLRTHLSSAMYLWINLIYISGDHIAWNARGGMDPFDFDAAEKNDPKNVGRFKINGEQMQISWGGGRPEQNLHVVIKGGKVIEIDAGGILKAAPYPKDARLDAAYNGAVVLNDTEGALNNSATLTFTKDGKFTYVHDGTIMYGATVPPGASTENNRQGTYQLTGNTLTLQFSNGKSGRYTVLPFDGALDTAQNKLSGEQMIFENRALRRVR